MRPRNAILTLLLSTILVAQQPAPAAGTAAAPSPQEQLQKLLQQLKGLDEAAWQAHSQQLEEQAAALDRTAATQRAEAKQRTEQAAAAEARAKLLREERKQLDDLRQLLRALPAAAVPTAPVVVQPQPAPTPPAPALEMAAKAAGAGKAAPAAMPAAPTPAAPAPAPTAQPSAKKDTAAKPSATPAAPASAPPAGTAPAKAAPKPAAAPASAAPAAKVATEAVAPKDAIPVVVWADVEPLFAERCAGCHDPDTKKGGLDISSFAATRQGGGSGKTITPGNAEQSRLYRMVAQTETPVMPKDADPLEAPALAKIRQWIEQGAAEDAASARAFLAEKEAKAKATAAAVEASMSGPPPLPENWPAVPVRLPPRTIPIPALARSPRAPLLILPGMEQLLLLDDALKIQGVLPCALPRTGVVSFSFDGTLLAAAGGESGRNGKAMIFDVKTGALQGSFGKERDIPLAIAVHKGRGLVALGGSSKHTRVYSLADGTEQLDGKHDDFVLGLDFSPDGSLLAAADRSGAVILWETDGGRIAQTLRAPKGAIQATAFHKSGRMVAAAVGDGTVRMFDVQDGKEKWSKQAHQGEALTLALGPGNRLASGGTDGRIAVLDDSGKAIATSDSLGDQIQALAFGATDDIVIGGDPQGRLHRFDAKAKKVTTVAPRAPVQ